MKIPPRATSVWERLCVWAETGAQLLVNYWLLLIGCLLVLFSVILKWVQSPFSHNISGLKFSLLNDPGVTPNMSLFSPSVLGLIALSIGLLFLRRFPALLGLAAAVIIMLWAIAPAQIAFRQPSMLRRLTYELQVVPLQKIFSKDYLSPNYGASEVIPKRLVLYSAWGRFVAAWSFLRLGWYCFGLGGLLIGAYVVAQMPSGKLARALVLLCLPVGALETTRSALPVNDADLIGQLQKQAGVSPDSAERHINRGVDLRSANEFEAAFFEFSRAAEAGGALSETVLREIAITRMSFGLALYRAGGIGSAVTNWELALREDPSLIYVLPYLARGYYDIGRYQSGIAAAQELARLIKDHQYALADAYSTAADCYAKLGQDAEARRYYARALVADPVLNYWALTGLAGE